MSRVRPWRACCRVPYGRLPLMRSFCRSWSNNAEVLDGALRQPYITLYLSPAPFPHAGPLPMLPHRTILGFAVVQARIVAANSAYAEVNSSSSALASCKSAVSNPSVNQP
jgi:hypothetical protein